MGSCYSRSVLPPPGKELQIIPLTPETDLKDWKNGKNATCKLKKLRQVFFGYDCIVVTIDASLQWQRPKLDTCSYPGDVSYICPIRLELEKFRLFFENEPSYSQIHNKIDKVLESLPPITAKDREYGVVWSAPPDSPHQQSTSPVTMTGTTHESRAQEPARSQDISRLNLSPPHLQVREIQEPCSIFVSRISSQGPFISGRMPCS